MGARRKARECALQMLFQFDLARQPADELIRTYWGELAEAADDVKDFANDLVIGVIDHLNEIDERIRHRTEHWRIEQSVLSQEACLQGIRNQADPITL